MYTSHLPACFPCFRCFSFRSQPWGNVLSENLRTLGRCAGLLPIFTLLCEELSLLPGRESGRPGMPEPKPWWRPETPGLIPCRLLGGRATC